MTPPNAPACPQQLNLDKVTEPAAFTYLQNAVGFSAIERACIDLRVPRSGTPWLDDLIHEARGMDAAAIDTDLLNACKNALGVLHDPKASSLGRNEETFDSDDTSQVRAILREAITKATGKAVTA